MKIIKQILPIVLFSISITAFSQNPIVVTVSPAPVSMDTLRSFVVVIPQTILKDVEKDWLKYLRRGSKGKATEANGVNLQTGAVNKNISAEPFNVYSRLISTTGGVRLNVWLGEISISKVPNSGQHLAVQKYVYDFVVQQYRHAVEAELKTERAKQQKLGNDLAGYIKSEEKSTKTVNANERTTERAKDAITTNNGDIQNSTDKISDQKQNVERNASDQNASKGAKKTLAELEDEKKDLQKENEKKSEKMYDRNKENRKEVRNIENSHENQANTAAALEKQKQVVHDVQTKLDNIQ